MKGNHQIVILLIENKRFKFIAEKDKNGQTALHTGHFFNFFINPRKPNFASQQFWKKICSCYVYNFKYANSRSYIFIYCKGEWKV